MVLVVAIGRTVPWSAEPGWWIRSVAASIALAVVIGGWRLGFGVERHVRGPACAAFALWFALQTIGSLPVGPMLLADVCLAAIFGLGGWCYWQATSLRLKGVDQATVHLDAAMVFAVAASVMLLVYAKASLDAQSVRDLALAVLFLGLLAAGVLVDLAARSPLRFSGPWSVHIGLALAGGAAVWSVELGRSPMLSHGVGPDVLLAIGSVVVAYGAGAWHAERSSSLRYDRTARWFQMFLPVVAACLAPVLILIIATGRWSDDGLAAVASTAVVVSLGLGTIRQTLLSRAYHAVGVEEQTARMRLAAAEARFRLLVSRLPAIVYEAEPGASGRWRYVSDQVERMLGYTPESWLSDPNFYVESIHPDDRARIIAGEAEAQQASHRDSRVEYRLVGRDGRVRWIIDEEVVAERDGDGRPTLVQGLILDITDRIELEDELRYQANHDSLTGLPNRMLLESHIAHLLPHDDACPIAVLFVDLDDMKAVNDRYGHSVGDATLVAGSQRLGSVLHADDLLGRLAGDEFAVLLTGRRADESERVARELLQALEAPLHVNGHEISMRASIGIRTSIPGDREPDDLLRDADIAMYVAKDNGKGCVRRFEPSMYSSAVRQSEIKKGFARALANDEFFLEYQPVVAVGDGTLRGVEALVRWHHPSLGRVLPTEFIALAEETGDIVALGAWVLRQACATFTELLARAPIHQEIWLSVNVSALQLKDDAFVKAVGDALRLHGLGGRQLVLEVTESVTAGGNAEIEQRIAELRSIGVRIALDDFGTGHASFDYIRQIPADVLKVAKSFVDDIATSSASRAVVASIVGMANTLSFELIAEGVETREQLQALRALGVSSAQGYLFSRPMTSETLSAALHDNSEWADAAKQGGKTEEIGPSSLDLSVPW